MNVSKYIDHTFLKPAGEKDAVRKLCREAKKAKFASVCVNPCEVALAAKLLKGSTVKVCTVIGFPLGANTTEVKLFEALEALRAGATELDFVVNQRLLKYVLDELTLFAKICPARAADEADPRVLQPDEGGDRARMQAGEEGGL